ncbi:MAG: TlpA disulfide reductase family protein [Bacteroidota bacterium]
MKTITATLLFLFVTQISFFQVEVTLEGDINDSTFMAKVEKMKAAGFNVKINEPDAVEVKHTNQKLPAFELVDLFGQKLNTAELLGKNIHINIWSTTCKPCIEEFPELNELKKNYENQDYVFVGMTPESDKKINKLLAKNPLHYRIIPNAQKYLDELGIKAFPVNFFVDKHGVIKKVIHGANYKIETIDGKRKMIPNNYEGYEKALIDLKSI